MIVAQTTPDRISTYRHAYFNSLPEFQELFLELMVPNADLFIVQLDGSDVGYAIINSDGQLIEFYILPKYLAISQRVFLQLLESLPIKSVFCKSFDSLLLCNCLALSLPYAIEGVLYRDYTNPLITKDPDLRMLKATISSSQKLLQQDSSIRELFETPQQLHQFVDKEFVFEFYKQDNLVGCGMVIRTHADWNFCDLGVWVNPAHRKMGIGSNILIYLREIAITNNMKPSCGCAIDNIASQKAIEKSGYVSRHRMIAFNCPN